MFRTICPKFARENLIYPLLARLQKFWKSLVIRSEPLRLSMDAMRMGWNYRRTNQAQAAVGKLDAEWKERIRIVRESPDNAFLARHKNAGKLEDSVITMHNGLKVRALGYYGAGILNMLIENQGVHEPQEERAFAEVLPLIPSGGTILELGAYWGFYSMWFVRDVPEGRAFLIEPDPRNIVSGKQNFRLNGLQGHFTQAAIGTIKNTGLKSGKIVSVGDFCQSHNISKIHILHSDIQGAETLMLNETREMFEKRKIDYVFLSTHGDARHEECLKFLDSVGYITLCSANSWESYSLDGLIVARSPEIAGPDRLPISHRASASQV